MNKTLVLTLAIGAGAVGLVLLHSLMAGQSAAASATSIGATLSAPFAVTTDAGGLANGVTVTSASSASSSTAASPTVALNPPPTGEAAPSGIDATGWETAVGGMNSLAAGTPPWAAISQGTLS